MRERACEHLAPFTWLAGRSPRTSASNARHRESLVRGEAKHPAPKKKGDVLPAGRVPLQKKGTPNVTLCRAANHDAVREPSQRI
jgi:hypothetical protein